MHNGRHKCAMKPFKVYDDQFKKDIRDNIGVKPNVLVNQKMRAVMVGGEFDWKQVDAIAEDFVDRKMVSNIREKLKLSENPVGNNFEALALYKEKCEERDKYLIYRVNNRKLNGKPSFVFQSSLKMAQTAIEMDVNKNTVLSREYAHVDGKHDKCKGFKTLTLWCYHPVMRKLLCLAIMQAEEENTENLTTFWMVWNELLAEVINIPEYKFNPAGFVADENHANWKSLKSVYGETILTRTVSCEFHFKQSVQRHARKIGDNDEFIELSNQLLYAETPAVFNHVCEKFKLFIKCHETIDSWFGWWYKRRTHIFRAFKPGDCPNSNLAEVGHAKMASTGKRNMSLLEATRENVILAIRQEKEVTSFSEGISTGGRGESQATKRKREYTKEMEKSKVYSKEIGEENLVVEAPPVFVAPHGIHRPPDRKMKIKFRKKISVLKLNHLVL